MDYQVAIINIINSISDVRFLAFLYGMIDELAKHVESINGQGAHSGTDG